MQSILLLGVWREGCVESSLDVRLAHDQDVVFAIERVAVRYAVHFLVVVAIVLGIDGEC